MNEIWITEKIAGIHNWPEAPPTVDFLRHPHRHLFHIKLGMNVTKLNRELEFFIEKEKLQNHLYGNWGCTSVVDFGSFSCEMIARTILDFEGYYSWVEVSEDGENGCIVRRKL